MPVLSVGQLAELQRLRERISVPYAPDSPQHQVCYPTCHSSSAVADIIPNFISTHARASFPMQAATALVCHFVIGVSFGSAEVHLHALTLVALTYGNRMR